jgi:hypothetical protein
MDGIDGGSGCDFRQRNRGSKFRYGDRAAYRNGTRCYFVYV